MEPMQLLVWRRPVDLSVGPSDEAVQRHSHRVDHLSHHGPPDALGFYLTSLGTAPYVETHRLTTPPPPPDGGGVQGNRPVYLNSTRSDLPTSRSRSSRLGKRPSRNGD